MPPRKDAVGIAQRAHDVMVAAGLEPLEPYPGSAQGWRCRCTVCGAEVAPRSGYVKRTGRGCWPCGIARRAALQLLPDPEAVMREAGFEPLEPYRTGQAPWRCRCTTCGNEVTPRLSFVKLGHGCRICAIPVRAAAIRKTRLARTTPEAATAEMLAVDLLPQQPFTTRGAPWPCRCLRCGTDVVSSLANVRRGSRSCPTCQYKAVSASRTLDESIVVAQMRAAGLEPLVAYPGTDQPWLSVCLSCGKECSPHFTTVRAGGGCRHCGAMRRGAKRAVPPETAVADMRAGGFEPLEDYPGTDVAWRCRCLKCGAVSSPRRSNVQLGRGCISCAPRGGFDPGQPGLVYVITHDGMGAHKVGICGLTTDRLPQWRRRGWRLVGTVEFADGGDALAVETRVLRWLRKDLGLPPATVDGDGFSETVDATAMSESRLLQRVQEAAALIRQPVQDASSVSPAALSPALPGAA